MRVTRRNEAVVTVYVTSSCLMWSTLTTRLQFLGDMKVWRTQRMTVHSLAMLLHVFVSVPPSSPLVSQFATRFSRSMDRLRSIRCNDDVDGNRSLAKFQTLSTLRLPESQVHRSAERYDRESSVRMDSFAALSSTKTTIKKWKEHREDDGAFTRSLLHPKIIQLRVKLDRRRKSVIPITISDRKSEGGAKKWRVSRVKSLQWQETDVNSTIYHLTRAGLGVHRGRPSPRLARLSDFTARNLISQKDSVRSGNVVLRQGGNQFIFFFCFSYRGPAVAPLA